jgi:hypothetical protein
MLPVADKIWWRWFEKHPRKSGPCSAFSAYDPTSQASCLAFACSFFLCSLRAFVVLGVQECIGGGIDAPLAEAAVSLVAARGRTSVCSTPRRLFLILADDGLVQITPQEYAKALRFLRPDAACQLGVELPLHSSEKQTAKMEKCSLAWLAGGLSADPERLTVGFYSVCLTMLTASKPIFASVPLLRDEKRRLALAKVHTSSPFCAYLACSKLRLGRCKDSC